MRWMVATVVPCLICVIRVIRVKPSLGAEWMYVEASDFYLWQVGQ